MSEPLHVEVLAKRQGEVLARVGPRLSAGGFYLGGGTAIALHLGHRTSIDLDWFSEGDADPDQAAAGLRRAGVAFEAERRSTHIVQGRVDRVPVDLVRYPYAPLRPPPLHAEVACRVATLDDLAAMKIAAIAQRGLRRDFIDLFALGGVRPLAQMLGFYRKRYGVSDVGHAVRSLVFFDDAEEEGGRARLLVKIPWPRVKKTIRAWVEALPSRL